MNGILKDWKKRLKGEIYESYKLNLKQKKLNNEKGKLDEEQEENEKKIDNEDNL